MGCPSLLTEAEAKTIQELDVPVRMKSATDSFAITQAAWVHLQDLDIKVYMLLYPGCPFLLSMGKLCDNTIDFMWPRQGEPQITTYDENGKKKRTMVLSQKDGTPICLRAEEADEENQEKHPPHQKVKAAKDNATSSHEPMPKKLQLSGRRSI